MVDHTVTLERDNRQSQQHQQQESFDSTKRFHIIFTLFKLPVIGHFNSQQIEALSHPVLQLYIICEVIYLVALIQVTGPSSPNLICRHLYIIFGTLASELLLWASLSPAMWLVVNMCLLVIALACLLARDPKRFREIVRLFEDGPINL